MVDSKFSMLLYLFVSLSLITNFADASHFLGGTITWRPLNASTSEPSVSILISQTYSWTWALAKCSISDIANGVRVPVNNSGIHNLLNCTANCDASNGYSPPPIWPYCTDVSPIQGSTVGRRADIVTVARNSDFLVAFADSAWRPLATSAAAAWSISSRLNIKPRLDNGLYNSAPAATMMSPVNVPVGVTQTIQIPIGDADGDTIRCRWSNGTNECADVCPPNSLPNNTVLYPNCTMIITGTKSGDWFAITLMVEDFANTSSNIPLSAIPIQFLIQVISPPTCQSQPRIIGLPIQQSCTPIQVGKLFTSQLIAINNCGPNVTIADIATLSFTGMTQTNITQVNTTTFYKSLSWTPTSAQLGFQVMCAMAVDSQSFQSPQYCFTFYVSQNGAGTCPGNIYSTTSTTVITSTLITTTVSKIVTNTTKATTTSNTITATVSKTQTPPSIQTTSTIFSTVSNICVFGCDGSQIQVSLILFISLNMFITLHFASMNN